MEKTDIKNREDVAILVNTFYDKIRIDATLGPIFNGMISDWDSHLDHLTTFWESSLFMTKKLEQRYSGNPIEAHIKVDNYAKNTINEQHFGIWLNYWSQTIDELFVGDVADNAKRRARKMATFIHINLFQAREQ
jgi:hemoglobin